MLVVGSANFILQVQYFANTIVNPMKVENQAQRILASALDGAVELSARDQTTDQPTVIVRTRDGRDTQLEVRWAGEGWPADVRRVARDVPDPWPEATVVVARHLSPGAIDWLGDRGANWADESGQARILGPAGILIIREPKVRRAGRPFSWSPSAVSIAEWILARPDKRLVADKLANASGWSLPQVANVLRAFDSAGWTVKRGPARGPTAHRELIDPDGLLAAWSAVVAASRGEARIAHRATRDFMELLRGELGRALEQNVLWAVSGWAGLELTAPYALTTPTLHIYVADTDFAGPLSTAVKDGGLRELGDGGRVNFWRADGRVLALAEEHDGLPVVDAPRLYADLASFDARGQDAADHVKRELIDPLHTAGADRTEGATEEVA